MDTVDPVVDVSVAHRRPRTVRWIVRIALAALTLVLFGVLLWFAGVELATPDGTGYTYHLDLTVARWFATNQLMVLVSHAEAVGVVTGTIGVLVAAVIAGVWLLSEVGRRVVVWVPLVAVVRRWGARLHRDDQCRQADPRAPRSGRSSQEASRTPRLTRRPPRRWP